MTKYLFLSVLFSWQVFAENKMASTVNKGMDKKEVIENPTLKTLSGSLNRWSLMSTYTYRGGSLQEPLGAERPNIRQVEAKPNLVDMSGTIGLKYRLTKSDNFSLQMGLYSTAPFHSSLETDNKQNKTDFDKNHQSLDADDPILSYFKTYYLGSLQNITFVKYQYVTRESYRDYGMRGAFSFSHAAAYRISKTAYIAGSLTYENYAYDKDTIEYYGSNVSIRDKQSEHSYRANLSGEFYLKQNMSLRLITDVFSYNKMRDQFNANWVKLQQTIAMTYFFNRDISIAPNIRFISEDIRPERTNLGLTLNVNL